MSRLTENEARAQAREYCTKLDPALHSMRPGPDGIRIAEKVTRGHYTALTGDYPARNIILCPKPAKVEIGRAVPQHDGGTTINTLSPLTTQASSVGTSAVK